MKKILFVLAVLLLASNAWSAGSCVQATSPSDGSAGLYKSEAYKITVVCTADASDGSIPNASIVVPVMSYLYSVEYKYGAVGATDDSDLVLTDSLGVDVLGTTGIGMIDSSANALWIPKKTDGGSFYPMVSGTLTQSVTQAETKTNSAVVTLEYSFIGIH